MNRSFSAPTPSDPIWRYLTHTDEPVAKMRNQLPSHYCETKHDERNGSCGCEDCIRQRSA